MRREVRYLLHLWSDGPGPEAWRARLVELASRQAVQFASLAELTEHLAKAPTTVDVDDADNGPAK
jgi:hypothetical protein